MFYYLVVFDIEPAVFCISLHFYDVSKFESLF